MTDFKPDRELESKEFSETFKTSKPNRTPRDIYNSWPIWIKNLAKVFVGVVVIVILVLIGRSIHHHAQKNDKNTGTSSRVASKKTTTAPSQTKAGSSGSNSTTSNSPAGSTSKNTASNAQSGKIVNTGPGDVAAVFAVAAFAGTSAHYVINRRQA